MITNVFSIYRLNAMILKEFIQTIRDYRTFLMLVVIPIAQVILLGFLINSDPKNLLTIAINSDKTPLSRSFLKALENTHYYKIIQSNIKESDAEYMIKTGQAHFIVNIPPYFSRDLIRGKYPTIFIEADAVDPLAVINPLNAASELSHHVFDDELQHGLNIPIVSDDKFNLIVHNKYNPALYTKYNSIPGLIGVVLTMSMVMITSISVARDRETGELETLLTTPVTAIEVILGKIIPHVIVGYLVFTLNLLAAFCLFHIPFNGSIITMYVTVLPFILASLAVGLTISTLAANQFQAVQLSTFYLLPTIILSGFLFPFQGMPVWARNLGELLPLTHYLRILRGIMVKGISLIDTWPNMWPILLFMLLMILIGVLGYHRTLD